MRTKNWMLATLFCCGLMTTALTSCSSSDDDNDTTVVGHDRKEFTEHVRAATKDLADNLNFGSWIKINQFNRNFNADVLDNEAFSEALVASFLSNVVEIEEVSPGTELYAKDFRYQLTFNLTDFKNRFTLNADKSFDIAPSDAFEIVTYDNGVRNRLRIKASGEGTKVLNDTYKESKLAIIGIVPSHFDFAIYEGNEGSETKILEASINNKFDPVSSSEYANFNTSQWSMDGVIKTDIVNSKGVRDITEMNISTIQRPSLEQGELNLSFIHNGKKTLELQTLGASLSNSENGIINIAQLDSSTSIFDILSSIAADSKLEKFTLTLNDDLVTEVRIIDNEKLFRLTNEANNARRYDNADWQTIDKYTQELNKCIEARVKCNALKQSVPVILQTEQFGIDNITVGAFKFADEEEYIPLTKLLDQQTIEYAINIFDHAAGPASESIVVARQLSIIVHELFKNLLGAVDIPTGTK